MKAMNMEPAQLRSPEVFGAPAGTASSVSSCLSSLRLKCRCTLLKHRLMLEFLGALPNIEEHLLVMQEADCSAALAESTGFPALAFPALFEERVREALRRYRRLGESCRVSGPWGWRPQSVAGFVPLSSPLTAA